MERIDPIVRKRKLLTINDMVRIFGKTRQTIHRWRVEKELPYIEYPDDTTSFVRFDKQEVIRWAKQHGIYYDKRKLQSAGTTLHN